MKPHIIQSRRLADTPPWLLQVDQPRPLPLADNHEGIALNAREFAQDGQGRRIEIERLRARLAVGKPDHGALEIDELPFERENLRQARPGERQEPDGSDNPRGGRPIVLGSPGAPPRGVSARRR